MLVNFLQAQGQDSTGILHFGEEIEFLTKRFMNHPYRKLENDIIQFRFSNDSTILAENVLMTDTNSVWFLYQDRGHLDFWGSEDPKAPKAKIDGYFRKNKIKVEAVYIYSSLSGPRKYLDCGGCYQGFDFLFKMRKNQFVQFKRRQAVDVTVLRCSYR
jgi:hypothetical protein